MIHIRNMAAVDIPLGMRLKAQNGWNQFAADWLRLLALEPDGCFVAEWDGVGVGTAGTCVFGSVAWIAVVLVDEAHRGRGIGTELMKHALAYLEGRGVQSIRLDATPLGQPIYEKLGFIAEYSLARYEGVSAAASPVTEVQASTPAMLAEICDFDRRVSGADRRKLIERLSAERSEMMRIVRRHGHIAGFAAARPGANAWQVGPCLADADAGPLLLADAAQRLAGQRVYLDIPLSHHAARATAERLGLTVQRQLLRMGRGPRTAERVDALWTSSGPEKG